MVIGIVVAVCLVAVVTGLGWAYADARYELDTPEQVYPLFGMIGAIFALLNALVFGAILGLSAPVVVGATFFGPFAEVGIITIIVIGLMKVGKLVQQLGRQARENAADRE
jgi:hypothetical protein